MKSQSKDLFVKIYGTLAICSLPFLFAILYYKGWQMFFAGLTGVALGILIKFADHHFDA